MIIALLTPMMLATSPLTMNFPPNTYSHQTQTTFGVTLAQNTQTSPSQYGTTTPTIGTQTTDMDGNNDGSDPGSGDSTVTDYDAD
jgi:hypothetical protein